jgi:hypothetical protein
MKSTVRGALTALLFVGAFTFVCADPSPSPTPAPKRFYVAVRLRATPPTIDGKLDDACWREAGDWAGNYTQFSPTYNSPPSETTQLKVLYDDKYLYVAIRAFDRHADQLARFASVRDDFSGDILGISFDTYSDHRNAFEFDLTAAGQKIDLTLTNDGWDTTWNAVWDGKVSHDAEGWSAEMRIPLSQLRYNGQNPQTWGMHAWRWFARNSEESQWKLLANDGSGSVYSFGELRGLELVKPRRHLELVPYVSEKYTLQPPAADGTTRKNEITGGLDAKLQLTSSFTLDATVNPDFGQVEADPSEMNLTAFETFLEERRPFFLEGKNILQFALDENEPLFYSRRIGHAPSLAPRENAYDIPETTSILGAWKITGKTRQGLSLGLLQAATAEEHARYFDGTAVRSQSLEPATQYFVVRALQEANSGNTTCGGIAAVTARSSKSTALSALLPKQSIVAGADLQHYWDDRTYYITAKVVGSRITGTPDAITELQTGSARYFQRPDARYVNLDPARTRLDGWGGYLAIGKGSKGRWRFHEQATAYSPGLELNELGYFRQADVYRQLTKLYYVEKEPAAFYRNYQVTLKNTNAWNFGGDHVRSDLELDADLGLQNRANMSAGMTYSDSVLDPAALRGGPALRQPGALSGFVYYGTDSERKWVAEFNLSETAGRNGFYREHYLLSRLKYRPLPALTFSAALEKRTTREQRHYVEAIALDGRPAYVVSALNNDSLSFTLRALWILKPELSLQYYGSPFGSAGSYADYAEIVAPRATNYALQARPLGTPVDAQGTLQFSNAGGKPQYALSRPDFSFGQFRSNLVLRWEFRPGSNFYAVWSQSRAEWRNESESAPSAIRHLTSAPNTNVFLIKCSYWFSL